MPEPMDDLVDPSHREFVVEGDLVVKDATGQTRVRLDVQTGSLFVWNEQGVLIFLLELPTNNLRIGGVGHDGDIVVFPAGANDIRNVLDASFHVDGGTGVVWVGGGGATNGALVCRDMDGNRNVVLDGRTGEVSVGAAAGNAARSVIRGGRVALSPTGVATDPSIVLNAENGGAWLGGGSGNQIAGQLTIRGTNAEDSILLAGGSASISAGGQNVDGDLMLFPGNATNLREREQSSIHLNGGSGGLRVGGGRFNVPGTIAVRNGSNDTTIVLDGDAGDIRLRNGDCAEEFELAAGVEAEPGTVLVIGANESFDVSDRPYDRRVAGVVAGAGGTKPGIILGRKEPSTRSAPVALAGRVHCKVDASSAPIAVGDLLTTSSLPGFAMKASDSARALGAILGKALAPIERGTGMIPILVALQ